MALENDLGRDDIKRLVWRIAIPSMLAQFVSVLYSIVDLSLIHIWVACSILSRTFKATWRMVTKSPPVRLWSRWKICFSVSARIVSSGSFHA